MDALSRAGWTIGEKVRINARNRHSHGWRGTVDGFSEEVPGVVRVCVVFQRVGQRLMMTFEPGELVNR